MNVLCWPPRRLKGGGWAGGVWIHSERSEIWSAHLLLWFCPHWQFSKLPELLTWCWLATNERYHEDKRCRFNHFKGAICGYHFTASCSLPLCVHQNKLATCFFFPYNLAYHLAGYAIVRSSKLIEIISNVQQTTRYKMNPINLGMTWSLQIAQRKRKPNHSPGDISDDFTAGCLWSQDCDSRPSLNQSHNTT